MSSNKKPSFESENPSTVISKHKRRRRADVANRNYTCGCGKSYLSYPALYTHLKQKHNGKQPLGTKLPSSLRGRRPRPHSSNSEIKDERNLENNSDSFNEEKLDDFLEYLGKFADFIKCSQKKDVKFLNEKEDERIDPLKDFPLDLLKNHEDYMIIYNNLVVLDKNPEEFSLLIDRETSLRPLSINKIFALFLHKISKYLTKEAYNEMCLFIVVFRRTLNGVGWKLRGKENSIEEFCEVNTGDSILQGSNELITNFLPSFVEEMGSYKLVLLGSSEEKIKNVIYMTQYFGNWLFNNYFTVLKLEINYD